MDGNVVTVGVHVRTPTGPNISVRSGASWGGDSVHFPRGKHARGINRIPRTRYQVPLWTEMLGPFGLHAYTPTALPFPSTVILERSYPGRGGQCMFRRCKHARGIHIMRGTWHNRDRHVKAGWSSYI